MAAVGCISDVLRALPNRIVALTWFVVVSITETVSPS